MLYVHNPQTNLLDVYPQFGADVTSTAHCPAACCDLACKTCSEVADCLHSEHGQGGMCVFWRPDPEKDHFACLAYYPVGVSYTQCGCPAPQDCPHWWDLKAEIDKRTPGTRPAGVQKQKFLAAQAEVNHGE